MNKQKYVCPSCSGLINYGTKFCPHCGTALNFSPVVQNDSVVNQNINNLQTQAEFHLAKIRLLHTLISVITFNETEVNVKQFNKWLPFVKTNPGTANFNIMYTCFIGCTRTDYFSINYRACFFAARYGLDN